MNYTEFSQKIKTKYPEYKDMDDLELSQKIVSKYPEYKSEVSFEEPEPMHFIEEEPEKKTIPADIGLAQSFAKGGTFGTAPLIAGGVDVLRNIGKNISSGNLDYLKDTGKSFEEGRKRFLESQGQYEKEAPVAATLADIAGGLAVPVGGSVGTVTKGLSVLQKIKQGAKVGSALGGAYGLGTGLSGTKEKAVDISQGLKGAGIGAGIGALGGVLGSAIPQGIKKLITSKELGRKLDYIRPKGTQAKTIENIINEPKIQKEAMKTGFSMNYPEHLKTASSRIENLADDVNKVIKEAYKDIPDNTKIDLSKTNAIGKMQNAFKEYVDNTDLLPNTTVLKETEEILNNLQNKLSKNVPKTQNKKKGYVTVYHRTNSDIKGDLYSKENTQDLFVSNKKNGQAEGYGKNIIELKVKKSDLTLDDVFPSGEEHYTLPIKKANEYFNANKQNKEISGIDFRNLKEMTSFLNERAEKFAREGDYTAAKMYNQMRGALGESRDSIPKIAKATALKRNTEVAKEILEKSLGVKLDNPKNASAAILSNFRDNKGSYVTEQVEEAVNILKNHPETKHLADISDKMKLAQVSYDLRNTDESKMLSEISKSRGLTMLDLILKLIPEKSSSEKAMNLAKRLQSGKITKQGLEEPFNLIKSPIGAEAINKFVQNQKAYGGTIPSMVNAVKKLQLSRYTLPRLTIMDLIKQKEETK